MAGSQLKTVVRRLRVLTDEGTDADLLKRFVRHQDEGAFAALLRRHGPLVLGVCRRVLRNHADAEDAFQATFLVLVRRAPSLRQPAALGSWLYGVASRTAQQARRSLARRQAKEGEVTPRTQTTPEPDDWVGVLDEELAGLPEKYRAALVLCDLQGEPRKEAARKLGCAEGTVASRLARGRELLARRLTRRGVTLPAGALAVVLSRTEAVPASLVCSTVQAAGGSAAAVIVALAERTLKAMFLSRLKIGATLVLVVGLSVTAVAVRGSPEGPVPQGQPRAVKTPGLSDAEFIRRACLDIRGSLPSDLEVHYFLQDQNPNKRSWLVGKLKEEARARKGARAPEEPGPLEGTWQGVAFEADGKPGPEGVVKDMRVVFQGDQMSVYRQGELIGVNQVWLEPTKRPAGLRLKRVQGPNSGRTYEAIYELERDRLRICLNQQDGGSRPAVFRTGRDHRGAGTELIELRRVKGP
jgi:RNA polymerase sigma factor (sigma-70 family)